MPVARLTLVPVLVSQLDEREPPDLLSKVHQFARLDLGSVTIVLNIVVRLQATVMEVLILIDPRVNIVGE